MTKKKIKPRITAGEYKNRKLEVPSSARPVTEKVKMSIFNTIAEVLPEAKCADLFSGSGNMGIEALSRGASFAAFVDNEQMAINMIKQNLDMLSIPNSKYKTFKGDYLRFVASNDEKYNIVFADPPFHSYVRFKVNRLFSLLEPMGIIVLKIPARTRNKSLESVKESIVIDKEFGKNRVVILQMKEAI